MATETTRPLYEHAGVSQVQPGAQSRATLALEGMTCASCAMRIEKGLRRVPGVKDASVNFATEQASVTYDPTQTNLDQMVRSVEAVGYKAFPQVSPPQQPVQEETASDVSATTEMPASNLPQADERSKRRRA